MLSPWIQGVACFFFGTVLSGCIVRGYEDHVPVQDQATVSLSRWSNVFQVDSARFDLRGAGGQVVSSTSLPWYARAIELRPGHTGIQIHVTLRARDVGEVDTTTTTMRFVCSGHGEMLSGHSYRLNLSAETLPPKVWLQDDAGATSPTASLQLQCNGLTKEVMR